MAEPRDATKVSNHLFYDFVRVTAALLTRVKTALISLSFRFWIM